jgi:hypothetical protein
MQRSSGESGESSVQALQNPTAAATVPSTTQGTTEHMAMLAFDFVQSSAGSSQL